MKFFDLFLCRLRSVGIFIGSIKELGMVQRAMQVFSLFNGADHHEHRFARAIKTGSIILLLFFGTFGLWAVFAPIESFVRGQGNIIYEERGQIVQHLEGGVIDQIYVKEGDSVEEGQALLLLKTPVAYSNHVMLNNQICIAQLTKYRLNAELNGQEELFFGSADTECDESLLEQQQLMFAARKSDLEQRILLIESHIESLKKEIEGIETQKKANGIQWTLNKEELATAQQLFEKNIIHKDQLVALKQKNAELEGKEGYYEASISKVKQQIAEDHIKISNAKNSFLYDVTRELKEVSANLLTLQEKRLVNTDIIERSIVRSPKNGVVKSLRHHTLGGIIAPGSAILEVVPVQSDLIIEAKISNRDIAALLMINKDILNPNTLSTTPVKVKTRIIAYSSRVVPLIEGQMYNISADAFLDGRNIVGYYGVYVRLPAESIAMLGAIKAYPGMPVEVYIPTTSRTLFSYLLKPIVLSFDKAFRET